MNQLDYRDPLVGQEAVLAEIRARTMQESLENVGRFNEDRVRARLLDSYNASNTMTVYVGSNLIGFYVIDQREDCHYLSHLYIDLEFQGRGYGKSVLDHIKEQFSELPILLNALKGSRSNFFYKNNGFVFLREDDYDNYYEYRKSANI